MARARNIKPGFFKNEDLAECSVWARLCFAGLWTLADREGRLEDRPKRIKGELFAFDSIEVEPLLEELHAHGFIERYRAESLGIIQVVAFLKHQNPHHREPESDLPPNQSPGPDGVGNSQKPEALPALQAPKAPDKPRASLGLTPPIVDLARGSSRAESGIDESGALIPLSGALNPESSSLRAEVSSGVASATQPAEPKPPRHAPKAAKEPAPSAEAWDRYANAYRSRYGAEPVRNAKVNGQLAQVVARLGAAEAPAVAGFFVGHQNALYVRAMHPIDLLLRDAEKLRTEWATNRQVTNGQATQVDRTQTNLNAFAGLIAEAKAREALPEH